MVYPARDERFMRILRKIVRGLCHHHGVMSAVPDNLVWADVLKYVIQPNFWSEMNYQQRDPEICKYRYQVLDNPDIHSAWIITFFERRTFLDMVGPIALDGWEPNK